MQHPVGIPSHEPPAASPGHDAARDSEGRGPQMAEDEKGKQSLELSKVEVPAIRQRTVSMLRNVSDALAAGLARSGG